MKLRNKETGKHGDYQVVSAGYLIVVRDLASNETWQYDCLEGFNDKWEDYKPAKPYIKDKKVRKFVRDWAEHWKIDEVVIRFIDSNRIDLIGFPGSTKTGREIDIQRTVVRNEIIYGNRYTIDELCGEEKE